MKSADAAANHRVCESEFDHHRGLRGFTVTQNLAGFERCLAATLGQAMEFATPVFVLLVIHDFEVLPGFDRQTVFTNDLPDHIFPPEHDRKAKLVLHDVFHRL